jgi:hypothetical protein
MKLPFFNRKRYLTLKCYTGNKAVYDRSPITQGTKESSEVFESSNTETQTFKTCWSRLATRKRSATLYSPVEFKFEHLGGEDGMRHLFNQCHPLYIDYKHNDDVDYQSRECVVTKICFPWKIYEDTNTPFVFSSHIRNTTQMRIVSGVISYKGQHAVNIFNLVPKLKHSYTVPHLTPLVSIFPMSELPLHVECYYDTQRYEELLDRDNHRPNLRADMIKRMGV